MWRMIIINGAFISQMFIYFPHDIATANQNRNKCKRLTKKNKQTPINLSSESATM